MKNILRSMVLLSAVGSLSLVATAAMQIDEANATAKSMLLKDDAASQIIEALVEGGRSLGEATAIAVDAASGDDRIALAKAGICASSDTKQAEKVGKAAIYVVPDVPSLIDQIEGAIEGFGTGLCDSVDDSEKTPPSMYSTTETSGSGVSGRGPGVSLAN